MICRVVANMLDFNNVVNKFELFNAKIILVEEQ